jgi:glycerate dehydrogenase
MKIVVLDGYTLNPGDLSWEPLERLGPCDIHDRTSPSLISSRAKGADALLTNKVVLTAEHFSELPDLRYVGVLATGTNVVDLDAARKRSIVVTNVPSYGTSSVAQHTFALLLELTTAVGMHSEGVRSGRWTASSDFTYWDKPLLELAGLSFGVVGLGQIGGTVARIAEAFGMRVVAVRRPSQKSIQIETADLETVLRQSDVLSLHCPLTPETQHLINVRTLSWMKPTAFLLNTSRGGLVDETALAGALNSGRLGGAGLDVLSMEPPSADNPLLWVRNCIITPHQSWATRAARSRLLAATVHNLEQFIAGNACNVVNG